VAVCVESLLIALHISIKAKMNVNPVIAKLGRRLRLGLVGGGPGSFVGQVHRIAARLDDRYEIVASALSSNPQRSQAAGTALGIVQDRAYGDFDQMLQAESVRDDGIDVLAVMTPNSSHYVQCKQALEHGMDVICDKPLTTTLPNAVELVRRVRDKGLVGCVTYNYSGYPMVRQARAMIEAGALGQVRMINAQYVQGHLCVPLEHTDDKKDAWRWDPDIAGPSYIVGDLGTHAYHLAEYVTGLKMTRLCADLDATIVGRKFHDYCALLTRYENGARGVMWITQAAAGACHGLTLRVHGETAGIEWHQEQPNHLRFTPHEGPVQILQPGGANILPAAARVTRMAMGHPEGYYEAFANLYSDVAEAIAARRTRTQPDPMLDFPTLEDGARGVRFIEAAVQSSNANGAWVDSMLTI